MSLVNKNNILPYLGGMCAAFLKFCDIFIFPCEKLCKSRDNAGWSCFKGLPRRYPADLVESTKISKIVYCAEIVCI